MDSLEKENLSGIKTIMSINIPIEYFKVIKTLSDSKNMSKSEIVVGAVKDYLQRCKA